MTVHDLRSASMNMILSADVAIIGAGPAGLTIARELENTPMRVLIIESGGFEYEAETQTLNAVENVGEPLSRGDVVPVGRGYTDSLGWLNDIPAFELRNRLIGGSTHTWIGKCAAFDEIDFAARPWLPVSGWPITRSDIQPALERAATLLNLGPNIYDERLLSLLRLPPEEIGLDRDRLRSFFWQFSHERATSGEPMRFANISRQLKAPNVDFLTRATVTEINLNNDGRCVSSLEAYSLEGNKAIVRAKTIVLCCGGIENARLLLASNSMMTNGIGNSKGIVGRYLADHPRTSLARFNGVGIDEIARHFNFFGLHHNGRTHFYLRGLSLSPDTQMREGLTNCAAYPVQVHRADDPWAALKRLRHGFSQTTPGDLIAVFGAMNLVASGLYRRLVQKRGLPHRSVELRFDAMVEQQLDAESRVTLSDRRDRFGKPLPRVDWKIGSVEIESMKRLALLISDEFPRVGLPRPHLADWIAEDDNSKMAFTDMAHPSCTTRMGVDPATSVVDANAMVHGVNGLFVAGSSVFPTGGHANPTLMLLALAIRLADHLKVRFASERPLRASLPDAEAKTTHQ